jgi:hypothetical protein
MSDDGIRQAHHVMGIQTRKERHLSQGLDRQGSARILLSQKLSRPDQAIERLGTEIKARVS